VYGLKYKNIHSYNDIGLVMLSKNRVLLPETADEYVDIPGRDGSILFAGAMKDRTIEVEFSALANTLPELRILARRIAAWLYSATRQALVFDDEPGLYYMARVSNQLDLEQTAALGKFTVDFRCEPLAYSVAESTFSKTVTTAPETITYAGTYKALPVITITATSDMTNPSITVEDKTLIYTGTLAAGQSLVINCETYQATITGVNALGSVSGDWPVLYPGENEVTMSTGCSLQIKYRERWL